MSDKKIQLLKLLDFGNEVDTSVGFMNVSGQNISLINGIRFLWFAVNYKDPENPTYRNPFANFINIIQYDNPRSGKVSQELYRMDEDTLNRMEDKSNDYYNPSNKGKSYTTVCHAVLSAYETVSVLKYYNVRWEFKMFLKGSDMIGSFKKYLTQFNKFLKLSFNTRRGFLTCPEATHEYDKEYECVRDLHFMNSYKVDNYNFFYDIKNERSKELWAEEIETYLSAEYPKLYPTNNDVPEDKIQEYMGDWFEEEYVKNWCNSLEYITMWMQNILTAYKTYCRELKDE